MTLETYVPPASAGKMSEEVTHFFTVDVEEYFQVSAFEGRVPRSSWHEWPQRLDLSLPPLLDMLERHGAKGTFFVLGWVAEHNPASVRLIASKGHEIASHGYWHRRIPTMSPAEFRADVRDSKRLLEDVAGQAILGFRAPSFSIIRGFEWTFDVLLEEGYRYDSSLFPVRRRGYGYPAAPKRPHLIRRSSGDLAEFPPATASVAGLSIPAGGGGYLRHFPLALIRLAFKQSDARKSPATFYVHPWEIDPAQPRVDVSILTRLRHYRGLGRCLDRIETMLQNLRFTTLGSGLKTLLEPTKP
jgi:polysaccharide deacetylase family protein (PEP-CTERM system associated)